MRKTQRSPAKKETSTACLLFIKGGIGFGFIILNVFLIGVEYSHT